MIVVSDASPIISLAAVGQLNLLRAIYREVLIPEDVRGELLRAGPSASGLPAIVEADWLISRQARDSRLIAAIAGELDCGEAAAIALALESGADLLLVDERRGRAVAVRLGLKVIGVLGVLVEAKSAGHLKEVRSVLDALRTEGGFWMTRELYFRVLEAAGEHATDEGEAIDSV